MLTVTRRAALCGALAIPAAASAGQIRSLPSGDAVRLYDASLEAGRRFARAAGKASALEGDAIRMARTIMARKPALIVGVSRRAEALLFAEAGSESGYAIVASLEARGQRCVGVQCKDSWRPVLRMLERAGEAWVERLAATIDPSAAVGPIPRGLERIPVEPDMIFAWVLAPR